jgi:hypothetical protein
LRAQAGVEELGAIGFFQIEQDILRGRLVAGGHPVEPLERVGLVAGSEFVKPVGSVWELGFELDGDFRADLVAAAADGRAEGGEQVRGLRAEIHLHPANGFYHDATECAPPSGMDGRDGALFGIDEKNGDAVGGLNAEEQAGAIGGGSVTAAGLGRSGSEELHNIGMELFERNEGEVV